MYKNKHECKNNHLQSGPGIPTSYKYRGPVIIPLLGILFTPVTHFFVHPFFPCILLAISRGTRQNPHGSLGEVSWVAHGSHGWTGRCVTRWIVTPCSILDSEAVQVVRRDEVVTCWGCDLMGGNPKNGGFHPQKGWRKDWNTLLKWMIWFGGTTIFGNIHIDAQWGWPIHLGSFGGKMYVKIPFEDFHTHRIYGTGIFTYIYLHLP